MGNVYFDHETRYRHHQRIKELQERVANSPEVMQGIGYHDATAVIRYLGDLDRAVLREDEEASRPEVTGRVYVVLTEVNGYRNLYGHVIYRDLDRAEEAASEARGAKCWDKVYVTEWALV